MDGARRLKPLEEENRQLKRLVADPSLDNYVLQDLLEKTPEARDEEGSDAKRRFPIVSL